MLHFVQNLQYYLSAEVLGTSWTAFLEQVGKANDLDSVIDAHNTYLSQMLQGALLGNATDASAAADTDSSVDGVAGSGQEGSQRGRSVAPLLSKLNQLFNVILRFHDAQDALQDRISDTVSRLETRAYERSQAERWGVADGDEYEAIAEDEELLRVSYTPLLSHIDDLASRLCALLTTVRLRYVSLSVWSCIVCAWVLTGWCRGPSARSSGPRLRAAVPRFLLGAAASRRAIILYEAHLLCARRYSLFCN